MKKALSLLVALAMLASAIPAVMAADITEDGLIAYLSFDDGIKAEIGGVKVNGTVTIAEGLDGNAASIPGGAGNYLFITDADGNNNLLVGKNAVTISFFENRTSERWPVFIAPNTNAQVYNSSENYIGLYDNDAFRLERYVVKRNDPTSSVVRGSVVSGWKHVAIVLTDTYSELFVNGVSVGKEDSASTLAQLFPTESYFQVGRGNWGSGEDFVGLIDELRVYDRALSDDEIAALAEFPITLEEVYAAIDITKADTTKDIALVTEYKGAAISWASSNAAIISDSGKLGETAVDKTVTLTATVTLPNGTVGTKEYKLTVKANVDEEAFKKALEIADKDNILDSVYLPTEVYGVAVKWTSSNTDVITDTATPNGDDYEIPAGHVNRGDSDVVVTVTAEYEYAGQSVKEDYQLTVKAAKEEEEKVAYLYAYFRGFVNESPKERLAIHVATSEDGYNWTDLNGNWPILESTMGTKALRDPYIIRSRYGDKFYLIATDLDTHDGQGWGPWSLAGSKYLAVWESEDLVNWSEQRMVKFANDDIGCAWAPEAVYDVDTDEYLVYASGKDLKLYRETGTQLDTVYVVRTRDFRSFSEPEIFFLAKDDNGNRVNAIDSTIIRADDGKYYHFYKKFNSEVWMMVSDHAAGPYEEVRSFKPIGGEGPAIYKDNNSDKYVLCIDDYKKYVPYITDDISSGVFTKGTGEITMSTGSKHGGMIPITQKEYDDLLRVYGPVEEDEPGSEPILSYDFESETEGLKGNAQIVEDEEKGKVLSLDGSDGTYFEFPENTFDRRDTFTLLMDVKSNMTGNFLTFAVGSGDTDHYMFFRARNNQLRMAGTISGWQYEHDAVAENVGIAGEWARIALVVKPGYYAIYKDGALVAENDNVTVTKLSKADGGGSLLTTSHLGLEGLKAYLGKSFFPDDAYVTGSFDNVALYNRALDAGEILKDANPDMTDESILDSDIEAVTLPQVVVSDLELPVKGAYGSDIVWTSSDESYITADGKVTRPSAEEGDVTVTLTAIYTFGSKTKTVTYKVTVKAEAKESWDSTTSWSGNSFEAVTEPTYIEFDFVPHANGINGFIGIYSSSANPGGWGDYNIIIRATEAGVFDAHNGSAYKASTIKYEAGRTYHVTVCADVEAKKFSAWITDDLGNTSLLAENYSFRSKAGSDLSYITVRGGDGRPAGEFTVEDFEIKDGPDVKAELGWDGTDFTINFTAAPADSIAVYSELDPNAENDLAAGLNVENGLALSTADSNRRYQAQATLGNFTGEASAPVSVYSLVAQAVVDFAFDGQIIADQLEKAKAVLNKGGVYIKDGELTAESAKLMDIDGDKVKLNDKAVKAGLRFDSVKYAVADGATADAEVSDDGTSITIEGLSLMEASVIYLEDVEFTLNIADETVADETVSGELDFIEEV